MNAKPVTAQPAGMARFPVHVHAGTLPTDKERRRVVLRDYLPDRAVEVEEDGAMLKLSIGPFPDGSYYIDPRLGIGLRWWADLMGDVKPLPVQRIPAAHTTRNGVGLSLSDAWTIAHWSRWWAIQSTPPPEVVVLHIDDHRDLMSPRLMLERAGTFRDLVTGNRVALTDPSSVDAAVLSGGIGMGSFLVPLLATGTVVHLRHLQSSGPRRLAHNRYTLSLRTIQDNVLRPGANRLDVQFVRRSRRTRKNSTYEVCDDLDTWTTGIPSEVPILVHIDLDYFNNRYDGDSDWRDASHRHDCSQKEVLARAHQVAKILGGLKGIVSTAIGASPGFCPAELWEPLVNTLLRDVSTESSGEFGRVAMGRRHDSAPEHTSAVDVRLVPGTHRSGKLLWHIYEGDKRAGRVEVRTSYTPELGRHQSIDVRLNQTSRGRGIGSLVFRFAAEASGATEIFAHASKSNIASRRAAAKAGYEDVPQPTGSQSLMVWRCQSHGTDI